MGLLIAEVPAVVGSGLGTGVRARPIDSRSGV